MTGSNTEAGSSAESGRMLIAARVDKAPSAEETLELVQEKLSSHIEEGWVDKGIAVIRIKPEELLNLSQILKLDSDLSFTLFSNVTAVDWMDEEEHRFELVYHLVSVECWHRLRIKIWISEDDAEIDSVVGLWKGADFMEREVYDMYGIKFRGHPNLKRILMYEEFEGHPLRKDYPIQGKQPRIPLRHPEVENTARNMSRPELVTINPGRSSANGS